MNARSHSAARALHRRLVAWALLVVGVGLLFTSWRWGAVLPGGLGVWLLTYGALKPEPPAERDARVAADRAVNECPECDHEWGEHFDIDGPWECSYCQYLIDHQDPDAPAVACAQPRPAGWIRQRTRRSR